MRRKARRAAIARFEELECRALLSGSEVDPSLSLLVGFKPGITEATAQSAIGAIGAQEVESFPDGTIVVALGAGGNPARALNQLRSDSSVRYAEADTTLQAAAVTPDDPLYPQQWGLNNANNVDIDAPEAWEVTTGSPSTIVAVLDTGIDLSNPEFAGRIWTNPDGGDGSDGYNGDVNGWNFIDNDGDVADDNGHGTHVAGILAAAGDNGYGVAGVAWGVTIMPVKVLDSTGSGSTDQAVSGIYFAVAHGAKVINASWGGGPYSQAMADAIAYANNHGVVFVAAAGNGQGRLGLGTDNDVVPSYPADYDLPNEISVAAIDQDGNLASFSDYGASTVDVGAPGVDIVSTIPGGFATYSGTSMATPYVAGTVALVASIEPNFTAAQLVQRIMATVKPLPGLAGTTISGGMVDAAAAVDPSTLPNPVIATGTGGGTTTTTTGGGAVATAGGTVALTPGGSTSDAVIDAILSSDDFYNAQGSNPTGFITGVYQALFGRAPDAAGLNYYVAALEGGLSRATLVQVLQDTPEARWTEVARWYQDDLGWDAPLATLKVDPGVQYWASLLLVGESDDQVLNTLLSSDDYFSSRGGTVDDYVTGLYETLLGRDPDPAGLAYYAGALESGLPRTTLVQVLQNTLEARRTEVARWYQDILGSAVPIANLKVDPGVEGWAGYLPNTG